MLLNRLKRWGKTALYDGSGELRSVSEDCEEAARLIESLEEMLFEALASRKVVSLDHRLDHSDHQNQLA